MQKLGVFILSITLILGAFLPNAKVIAANQSITITADSVNVHEGPGLSYPLVAQVKKGDVYPVLNEDNNWSKLQLANGKVGWVANWLLSKNTSNTGSTSSATTNTSQLRVRSGPGTSFQINGYLMKGQKVDILDQNENWTKISTSFGDGWVSSEFLDTQEIPIKNSNSTTTVTTGTVTGDSVNVRSNPSTSSTILGKLSRGNSVKILSIQNSWFEINFSNRNVWVSSQYITINQKRQSSPSQSGVVGTVTADGLHIRSSASLNSSVVGTVNKGQTFTILEEKNNWDRVEYKSGSFGWIGGWFLDKTVQKTSPSSDQTINGSNVIILQNGTNIRKSASLQSDVVLRANEGDTFPIIKVANQWYEIKLKNGLIGYIAGWIVSINGTAPRIEKPGVENYFKNKTIVLDPGHGGQDSGTTGFGGTQEKDLTLRTATLLYDKLKSSGANVILTRNNDTYISLPDRVSASIFNNADAFISLHYDSDTDRSVRGTTGYYYYSYQKQLANTLHSSLVSQTRFNDRGIRFGDFHVIRENSQKATLLELGYLSNPEEEMTMNTGLFQESAATGIYNGLAHFFMENK
ncbi:MAG: SH3 domain-containing protein [Bacillota bacterium]|nr:SH3 domain-containing protein [Bacillota bacterium]